MKEKKRQAEEFGYLGYSYAFKKQVIEEYRERSNIDEPILN